MSNEGKSKFVYSKLANNPKPILRRDRSKWHLKNLAKAKGLGSYRVPNTEQRLEVKRRCEEFDRANRVTREEVYEMIRKVLTAEYKWEGRVRITKDGIQDIVRR